MDQDLARDDLVPVLSCAAEEREVGQLVAAADFSSSSALLDAAISAETEMLMVNSRAVL
jgi:short-subunit dehydrogenase